MWTRDDFAGLLDPPLVGMIHLLPLPGAPEWGGDLDAVIAAAADDLAALAAGGLRAVMVENFHDAPFWPDVVPPETATAMAVVVRELRRLQPDLACGVNVLRNDARSALAVAAATGAHWIRVNVHVGAAVTDQGLVQGAAHRTVRRRRELGLDDVAILADLRVKHAAPLAARPVADEARDLRLRGRADALVVTGEATGSPADPDVLRAVREAVPDCPLLVGSGVTVDSAHQLARLADGAIVGTSLKQDGRVVAERVRAMVAAWRTGKET